MSFIVPASTSWNKPPLQRLPLFHGHAPLPPAVQVVVFHHSGSGRTADPSRSAVHGGFHPSKRTLVPVFWNLPSTPADIRRPLLVAKVPQHASGRGFWICQLDRVLDESSIQTPFHALDSKISHSTISHKFIILLQSLIAAISTAKRKCTFSSTAIVRPNSHCSCCKSSHHCAKLRKQLSKRLLKFHLC